MISYDRFLSKQITLPAVIGLIGYCLLLGYFALIDHYHLNFFATGFSVVIYNFCRLLFIMYSFWLYYALGYFFFKIFKFKPVFASDAIQFALLKFFSGVGILHIVLFFMGLGGLYNRPLMSLFTIFLFVFSLSELSRCMRQMWLSKTQLYWPGFLIFLVPVTIFLITKGLYPAGGHDYYMHYFYFYRRVIETGSIVPNEVWYHFYYSKGAALFFLSMLLTDPLGPQLASTTLIFAAAGIIYSILSKSFTSKLFPWLGAAIYFAFLIYTPGPLENMQQGGWGDLEKTHEPAAVLFLAILWQLVGLIKSNGAYFWGISLILTASALILISPVLGVYAGAFFTFCTLFLFFKRIKPLTLWMLCASFTVGAWVLLEMCINYYFTGLPDDHVVLSFWPWIDFQKMINWGMLFELVASHMSLTGRVANQIPISKDLIYHIFNYLRLDIWAPLIICASILIFFNKIQKKFKPVPSVSSKRTVLYIFGGFVLLVTVLSIFIGRDEYISYYRFTTFMYAPILCFTLLLFPTNFRILSPLALFLGFIYIYNIYYTNGNFNQIVRNAVSFSTGRFSIADAYRNQQGWPGRMPWGGISPVAEKIWNELPRHTRVWSMHVHTYCMLPDCRIESYQSYRLSPHLDMVYFGDPASAKQILKNESLNYFFFSTQLQMPDPLPRSNLFSPKNIANYFGIVWTDGENTLLTWKEQASIPIDSKWIKQYKKAIEASPQVQSFRFRETQFVIEAIKKNKTIKQQDIPWYQAGWKK